MFDFGLGGLVVVGSWGGGIIVCLGISLFPSLIKVGPNVNDETGKPSLTIVMFCCLSVLFQFV